MANPPPTDLSWFNLNRYEPCKQWGPGTWLRVLKTRKSLYEWAKRQRDAIGREKFIKVITGIPGDYWHIFIEPQKLLDEEPGFEAWYRWEVGEIKPKVTPLSFHKALSLAAYVTKYNQMFMEPVYHYAKRGVELPKNCRDEIDGFKVPDIKRYELAPEKLASFCAKHNIKPEDIKPKVIPKGERERIAELLGFTKPEAIPEDYDFSFNELDCLSVDELAYSRDLHNGSLSPIGRRFNVAHVAIDLNADDELLKQQFAACLDELRKRLNWQSVENIPCGDVNKKLPKQIIECDFAEWHRLRLLPFLDISIFSWVSGIKVADSDMLDYLFPKEQHEPRKITRTRANAEAIISETALRALEARAHRPPE